MTQKRSCSPRKARHGPSFCRFALFVLLLLFTACGASGAERGARGAGTTRGIESFLQSPHQEAADKLDPCASAAVFVGFSKFQKRDGGKFTEIPYAYDDAVDLAHLFAFDLDLVCPEKVTLILSGEPEKKETKDRYRELKKGEARILRAETHEEVLAILEQQARRAEANGLFIVAFSTHGLAVDQQQYLMTPFSSYARPNKTGIGLEKIFKIESKARSSIFLIDACRKRVLSYPRRATASTSLPRSAMSPLPDRELPEGQAIFMAAPPNGYAWDNDKRKNGVFTVAFIDALKECLADTDQHGHVNFFSLASYAQKAVTDWEKEHERPEPHGIEAQISQSVGHMPLAFCRPLPPLPLGEILEPRNGDKVTSKETLRARVFEPGLYATVLVYPIGAGVWWVQNNSQLAFPNEELLIPALYGGPDRFRVVVALTADPTLFRRGSTTANLPQEDGEGRAVRYLGPVMVERVE